MELIRNVNISSDKDRLKLLEEFSGPGFESRL